MWAIVIQASADATDFSQSFANRRRLPSHAKVPATTQRRRRTSKPLALSVRLTICRVNAAIFCSAPYGGQCLARERSALMDLNMSVAIPPYRQSPLPRGSVANL